MGRPRKNYDDAVEMYNGGLTIEAVAGLFNMKGQAMREILRIRGVSFRPKGQHSNMNKKYKNIVSLYKNGSSLEVLAVLFEVTQHAVYKLLRRRGLVFKRASKTGKENHMWRGTKKKEGVSAIVACHLKAKKIHRPDKCENCGRPFYLCNNGRSGIQAHHCDYNRPLDIVWLCRKCHYEWHRNNKAVPHVDDRQGEIWTL